MIYDLVSRMQASETRFRKGIIHKYKMSEIYDDDLNEEDEDEVSNSTESKYHMSPEYMFHMKTKGRKPGDDTEK
tara:strand:- start:991 stop:1212 length:222 start_codon:yes stop_codon:yes gene_type:complete